MCVLKYGDAQKRTQGRNNIDPSTHWWVVSLLKYKLLFDPPGEFHNTIAVVDINEKSKVVRI